MRTKMRKIFYCLSVMGLFLAVSPIAVLAEEAAAQPAMYATFWSLVPPVVAIILALITKEVYSSLFLGILVGGVFYSGFSFEGTVNHIFQNGFIGVLSDSYNVGILVFLVILGTYFLFTSGYRIHSKNSAPAFVQISHNISGIFIRNNDFQRRNWL